MEISDGNSGANARRDPKADEMMLGLCDGSFLVICLLGSAPLSTLVFSDASCVVQKSQWVVRG